MDCAFPSDLLLEVERRLQRDAPCSIVAGKRIAGKLSRSAKIL
jgi:hypothetical protein